MYAFQQLGTMPTITEDQDSQSTITPDTRSISLANADSNQSSASQMSITERRTSGFSTSSQTPDWASSFSPYHMEHPMSLPAEGSGFSTPSQNSESSLSRRVHPQQRIELMTPLPLFISHPSQLMNGGRSAHLQRSVQAHLNSGSVSPTSSYMAQSVRIPSIAMSWVKYAYSFGI